MSDDAEVSPAWTSDDEAQFPSIHPSAAETSEPSEVDAKRAISGEIATAEGTDETEEEETSDPQFQTEDLDGTTQPVKKEKIPEQPYTGLPPSIQNKKYKPDYPKELHYHKICTPMTKKLRRTIGNLKTQPALLFSPADSNMNLTPDTQDNVGNPKKKSIYANYGGDGECHARQVPPVVSLADEEILDYIEKFNIQLMFEYFLGMCVFEAPADPYLYIAELATKLAGARDNCEEFRKLPKLIHKKHLEALYRLYDKVGTGKITYTQYQNAMENLGLVDYNDEPEGWEEDIIKKSTFIKEAKTAIKELIRSFQMNEEMLTGQTGDVVREAREQAKIACLAGKEEPKV